MEDRAKATLEELIIRIFQNRVEQEAFVTARALSAFLGDHATRNVVQSGFFKSGVGRIYAEALQRVSDSTLEELLIVFRQAGRRDPNFFWSVVGELVPSKVKSAAHSARATAVSYCKQHGGLRESDERHVTDGFDQILQTMIGSVKNKTDEYRQKANFVVMKSPEDRRANQVPDIAVMMWFPNPATQPEEAERAIKKFEAIKEVALAVSGGIATIDKVDNPEIVHKDRISPSVERWLEKSVLVICDLEGNRPNVFYEFGYARASGTDVIATRPAGQRVDFHLAQWNIDEYANLDELKTKLAPRLKTILSKYDLSGSTKI